MASFRNRTLHAIALAAAPVLAAAGATPAFADQYQVVPVSQYVPDSQASDYGGFNIVSTGDIGDAGPAGRFLDTIQDTTTGISFQVYSFCIDAQTVAKTFKLYNILPVSAVTTDTTKQEQLAALLTNAGAAIAGATDPSDAAAGIQLAVWAVAYDTGVDSGYDLTTGNFNTYGNFGKDTQPFTLANAYLQNIEDLTWTGNPGAVRALLSADMPPETQNQIFLAVPEAKSWIMMILGFGLLGAGLRRRPAPKALAA